MTDKTYNLAAHLIGVLTTAAVRSTDPELTEFLRNAADDAIYDLADITDAAEDPLSCAPAT